MPADPSPPPYRRLDDLLTTVGRHWHVSLKDVILVAVVVAATLVLLAKLVAGSTDQALLMVLSGLIGSITTMLTGHGQPSPYGAPYGGMGGGYGAEGYPSYPNPATGGMGGYTPTLDPAYGAGGLPPQGAAALPSVPTS